MMLNNDIARCTGETHRDEHPILCPVRDRCKRYQALVTHEYTLGQQVYVMAPPTPGEACRYFMEAEIHEP